MKRNQRLKELAKQLEVSFYVMPDHQREIAHERTQDMVSCFFEAARGVNWSTAMDYVERLAQSAYMQGVMDAAIAVAKNPEMFK